MDLDPSLKKLRRNTLVRIRILESQKSPVVAGNEDFGSEYLNIDPDPSLKKTS